jgi:DNA-binding YbaB/EbfC family protein
LGSLMKQAQEITGRMQGLNEQMRQLRATRSAGGGMVEVEVNGLMEVLGCRIDESLMAQGDRELLEDLVVTAVNQATVKGKELHAEAMQEITGSLNVPGLEDTLGKFLGKGPEGSPPVDPTS